MLHGCALLSAVQVYGLAVHTAVQMAVQASNERMFGYATRIRPDRRVEVLSDIASRAGRAAARQSRREYNMLRTAVRRDLISYLHDLHDLHDLSPGGGRVESRKGVCAAYHAPTEGGDPHCTAVHAVHTVQDPLLAGHRFKASCRL